MVGGSRNEGRSVGRSECTWGGEASYLWEGDMTSKNELRTYRSPTDGRVQWSRVEREGMWWMELQL